MSANPSPAEERGTVGAVRIEAVFHVLDERHAQTVAARMVDRAHEIANLPECECDVDVSIQRMRPDRASTVDRDVPPANGPPAAL